MIFTTRAKAKRDANLYYLGKTNSSSKVIKSSKIDNVLTYILYLSPANTSGYEVCKFGTAECRKGCLATSGRAAIELWSGNTQTQKARIRKTKLFFEYRTFFMDWLIAEIEAAKQKAIREKRRLVIRLNGTSDIDWGTVIHKGKNIFNHFPHLQFYDYTKQVSKFSEVEKNYHLTLSYTGRNWDDCKTVLDRNKNVAMVFNLKQNQPMPKTYMGYEVINGDISDYRVKDKTGVIVGLYWKRIANHKDNERIRHSIFAIQESDSALTW